MIVDHDVPDKVKSGVSRYVPQVFLLTVIALTYLYWSWTDQLVGFGGDNAFYVMMARHYSPYSSATNAIAEYFSQRSQFPPLYPLVLALLGGANDFLIAHQITTGLLIAAFAALALWARRIGLSEPVCIALTLAFAILPGTYRQTLYLHSENLYLLLTLTFFALASSQARPGPKHYLMLALLAGAVALTRTAGISLVGAFVCYVLIRRPRGWPTCALMAVLPLTIWNIHAYALGVHYIHSVPMAANDDVLPQLVARVTTQFQALQYGWLQNLTSSPSLFPYCLALGAFCVSASVLRAVGLNVDGLYVVMYLLMMLMWPFPAEAERFIFAVVPVLLLQGCWLLNRLAAFAPPISRLSHLSGLIPSIAIVMAIPNALLSYQRIQISLPSDISKWKRDPGFLEGTPTDARMTAYTNEALTDAMRDVSTSVPDDDCVIAIKPSVVALLSGRLAKAPPGSSASEQDLLSGLRASTCGYAIMLNVTSPTYPTPLYPLTRLNGQIELSRFYTVPSEATTSGSIVAVTGKLVIGVDQASRESR